MTAYYNEIDKFAAQMLRNLIAAGHIAPGVVDERSIEDVKPNDLRGFTQCHFFAGVGVWSLALRRAGWPDSRPVWTGSCPCQPFSAAGKGDGFADERHLWPAFLHLIGQCEPATVIGEQVASKAADPWIDLVHTDMEALGYAFGAVPFPSAGVGAPHIRDRLYWMADAQRRPAEFGRLDLGAAARGYESKVRQRERLWVESGASGDIGELGNPECQGLALGIGDTGIPGRTVGSDTGQTVERAGVCAGGMEHADGRNACTERQQRSGGQRQQPQDRRRLRVAPDAIFDADTGAGPTNGLWRDADWLFCRDGKWRPVEPGTFPLAHGAPARVGRLRAYGNAINAEAARVFIEAVMQS